MSQEEHLNWTVIGTEAAGDFDVFRIERRHATHPVSGRKQSFSVIDCPDWVNVLALTPDEQLVFVRQYRPGVARITLEIPGGVIDPQERPDQAARRELAEETGFGASNWRCVGCVEPNPALQGNRCWTFLATNATRKRPPQPDEDEVIEVVTHPLAGVSDLIRNGTISHSLVVAAIHLHSLWADPLGSDSRPAQRV